MRWSWFLFSVKNLDSNDHAPPFFFCQPETSTPSKLRNQKWHHSNWTWLHENCIPNNHRGELKVGASKHVTANSIRKLFGDVTSSSVGLPEELRIPPSVPSFSAAPTFRSAATPPEGLTNWISVLSWRLTRWELWAAEPSRTTRIDEARLLRIFLRRDASRHWRVCVAQSKPTREYKSLSWRAILPTNIYEPRYWTLRFENRMAERLTNFSNETEVGIRIPSMILSDWAEKLIFWSKLCPTGRFREPVMWCEEYLLVICFPVVFLS